MSSVCFISYNSTSNEDRQADNTHVRGVNDGRTETYVPVRNLDYLKQAAAAAAAAKEAEQCIKASIGVCLMFLLSGYVFCVFHTLI